jgi:hypothetical protein
MDFIFLNWLLKGAKLQKALALKNDIHWGFRINL